MSLFDALYMITKEYRELKIKTTENLMIFTYEHDNIKIEKKILWRALNKNENPDKVIEYVLLEMHDGINKLNRKNRIRK